MGQDEVEIVKMNIAAHVSVADTLIKNVQQSIFLLNVLRQCQVCGLGAVRDVGILLVGTCNKLIDIVQRHAKARMHAPLAFQPSFQKLCVDHLPDERGCDHLDTASLYVIFDLEADIYGSTFINKSLPEKRVYDPAAVPPVHGFTGSPDK